MYSTHSDNYVKYVKEIEEKYGLQKKKIITTIVLCIIFFLTIIGLYYHDIRWPVLMTSAVFSVKYIIEGIFTLKYVFGKDKQQDFQVMLFTTMDIIIGILSFLIVFMRVRHVIKTVKNLK